jgi:hypothetical protein
MKTYIVRISNEAYFDIENLQYIITEKYKSPITAKRYVSGIINQLNSLSYSADSYSISTSKSFFKYGISVRRINYKKMAIIYTISGNLVVIQRIIPGALFTEL